MEIISFVMDYWFIALVLICAGVVAGASLYKFVKLPTAEQVTIIKDFIYDLVLAAEKELGGSTGQAKFAKVITWFYSKCPVDLRRLFPEALIMEFVEEAVERMKEYFKNNPKAQENILNK